MATSFRFRPSEIATAAIRVYDNNNHLVETIVPHRDSTSITFRTPLLATATRYFVSYQEPKTGCESQRIPLEVELEERPHISNISYRAPDCGGGTVIFTVNHSRSVDSLLVFAEPPLPENPNPLRVATRNTNITTFNYVAHRPTQITIRPYNRHCGFGNSETKNLNIYPSIGFDTLYGERNPNNLREFCIVAKGEGGRSGNYIYQIVGSHPRDPNFPDPNVRNTTGRFCDPRIKIDVHYDVRICDPTAPACCITARILIFSDFVRAQNPAIGEITNWQIYPNPTQGIFNLKITGDPLNSSEVYNLELLNTVRQLVWSNTFAAQGQEWNFELPENLNDGLYFIRLHKPNGPTLLQQPLLLQR